MTATGGGTGGAAYVYDLLDRVTAVNPGDGRRSLTLGYERDQTNHRWITHTKLSGLARGWDELEDPKGRLSQAVNPFGQSFQYYYDADGKPVRRESSNGTYTACENRREKLSQ